MEDNAGRYYICNGELRDIENSRIPDTKGLKAVYEVIRLIDGVPLFLEDHYERMKSSLEKIGSGMKITLDELTVLVKSVASANDNAFCNIKVMVMFDEAGQQTLSYMSKSYYPDEETVKKGVKVGLMHLTRENPNIKLMNLSYKEAVNKKIRDGGLFEVLLVDGDGNITEGSRSNMFYVRGDTVFTAPGRHVLMGITRKYIIEACKTAGYNVIEAFSTVESLKEADGLFLSGTSIKVLPVTKVEGFGFRSSENPVIRAVSNEYDKIIKKYIDKNVKIW